MNDLPEVKHVAIIMDGNGRWAKKHDLPRVEGHKKGADTVEDLFHCPAAAVKTLHGP